MCFFFFNLKWICSGFFYHLYWSGRNPIDRFNPSTFCACLKPGPGFPRSYKCGLFYIQWFEVRGDCLICWYLWNCWRSLFKLSFYNSVETYNINFLRAISNTLCKRCPLWNVPSCVKCTVTSFFITFLMTRHSVWKKI